MQTVTVSEQGQVVIPIDIRKQLGITTGCQLSLILEGSGLRIEVSSVLSQHALKMTTAYLSAKNPVKGIWPNLMLTAAVLHVVPLACR
jgi:AbrB family looped-hinge helix DNA binding protein